MKNEKVVGYSVNDRKWSLKVADLDYSTRGVVINDTLVMCGGYRKNKTWLYDYETKAKVREGCNMINERGFHGIIAFREFVWVFCGSEGKNIENPRDSTYNVYLNRCEKYDILHNNWLTIEPVPGLGRENPAVVGYKD
jgi:hypothetical protein